MDGELFCVKVGEVFKMRGCDINGDNSGRFSCGSTVVAVDGVVVILTMGGLCSSGDDSGGCSFSQAAETSVTADVVVDVVVLVLTITLFTLVIAGDLQVALVSKI